VPVQVGVHTTVTWAVTDRERVMFYVRAQQDATRTLPGCLACWWTADLDDPAIFHEWEWWESEEAFTNHVRNGPKFSADARALVRRVLTYRYEIASATKAH
jgi:quinol monooxygenase YgiN